MAEVPAHCEQCGLTFTPGLIQLGPGVTSMSGVGTSCPRCGGIATYLEGEFRATADDLVEALTASRWTRQKLAEYQRALQWAIKNFEEHPDEAIYKIKRADPAIGSLFDRVLRQPWSRGDLISLLSLLLTVAMSIWTVMQGDNSIELSPDQVRQLINHVPEAQSLFGNAGFDHP